MQAPCANWTARAVLRAHGCVRHRVEVEGFGQRFCAENKENRYRSKRCPWCRDTGIIYWNAHRADMRGQEGFRVAPRRPPLQAGSPGKGAD